ncbi:PEP-CTERM sorting domain-containing protein [Aquisphaera insulae]|uniref:PEP-CTERM sorting domain-containing protein n=1 Tax=Aquisphaera insulae TaxID=2712864 RepID=UPI0013EBFE69|nr:PEP-CTERM sorting domain-containing protein [Aquisphaera insulae]
MRTSGSGIMTVGSLAGHVGMAGRIRSLLGGAGRGWMLGVALLLGLPAAVVQADQTSFTVGIQADFEFKLLGNTMLNPGKDDTPFMAFRAIGNLTFDLAASIDDPSATTVAFTDVKGVLQGVPPSPGNTLPFTLSPNLEFLGGELTNIQRDGTGHVVSADVTDLEMRWYMTSTNPAFPVTLYTKVGLPFGATNVSVPFAYGTLLAGPEPFDGYLALGGDPANDPLVAVGRNRTLTVIPEPSSLTLLGLGLTGATFFARRRTGRHAPADRIGRRR